MICLCGKEMILLGKVPQEEESNGNGTAFHDDTLVFWVCPPSGCGCLFMGDSEEGEEGTFYRPEQNMRRSALT